MWITANEEEGGFVRATVVDEHGAAFVESEPIHNSVTDGRITWRAGWDPIAAMRTNVRLRFELLNAELYSFGCTEKPSF